MGQYCASHSVIAVLFAVPLEKVYAQKRKDNLQSGMGWFGKRASARRAFIRAGTTSCIGKLHEADGIPNQDRSFTAIRPHETRQAKEDRFMTNGVHVIVVCDGHGVLGHIASGLAVASMKAALNRQFEAPQLLELDEIARTAFIDVASALDSASCSMDSGSTCSLVLVRGTEIVIAWVGDSSAAIISKDRNKPSIRYITPSHRTSTEAEAERIIQHGGIIRDEYVIDQATESKGIAVSRTLGDLDMRVNGCISEPEVIKLELLDSDRAIVVATDGLWDVPGLTQSDILNTVAKRRRHPKFITDELMGIAKSSGPSDDCTISCMTFRR